MSHFTCLVIGDDVQGQLERYNENNMRLHDATQKWEKKFNEEKISAVQDEQGNYYVRSDDRFWVPLTREEKREDNWSLGIIPSYGWSRKLNTAVKSDSNGAYKFVLPKGYTEVEITAKEMFSFKDYMTVFNNYPVIGAENSQDAEESHVVLDTQGQVLYIMDYCNPEARWDWYSIGGRYTDWLKTKDTNFVTVNVETLKCEAISAPKKLEFTANHPLCVKRNGNDILCRAKDLIIGDTIPTVGGDTQVTEVLHSRYANEAFAEDIDFQGMLQKNVVNLESEWEKAQPVIEPWRDTPFITWDELRSKDDDTAGSFAEKTRKYNSQPIVSALKEAKIYGDPEFFLLPKEEFIEKFKYDTITPYALVENGEWFSRGNMGWWGISTENKSSQEWQQFVWDKLFNLKEGTLVTVVDCHI